MQQKDCEVNLKDVCLSYGDNCIFDGFNAVFGRGINVVLGTSGSGKTTLLNVITGIVPYKGVCNSPKPSMVFSEPTLSPVSAENNVRLILGKNCGEQVDCALRLARIEHKRKQNVTTLSDGEKQRVALARAFASERKVMLLDEPFSRLDYGVKQQLYATLAEYAKAKSNVTVLVTHDIDEALALADKIYYLSGRPCRIQQIAELSCPQAERDIYDCKHNNVRKRLQLLFSQTDCK